MIAFLVVSTLADVSAVVVIVIATLDIHSRREQFAREVSSLRLNWVICFCLEMNH